ncbi:MAG: pyridoxal-phosphate dependent enzyme [Oscillatoriaceae cyanobacterium Prado104]|jgi:cysteine synthase|nr:pyridoxal-phosphate dependent enzyme [Oscillatoriaceae cyanobacterium Prado104]
MNIYANITEIIGHTPLVQLQRLPQQFGCVAEIVLKLEGMNPAKSVKDRIAVSMMLEAEQAGLIQPGISTIVEATSGNTGIGLAMACAAKGYHPILTMPDNIVAIEPANSAVLSEKPAGFHNLQGIGAGFIPDVLRVDLIDEIVAVTEAQAYETGRQLAQVEGIMSGISTGAAVCAGLQIGQRSHYQNQRIAIVQPSAGERYLSTAMWAELKRSP